MKMRTGFVSNSSSSSFVVAFPVGFVPAPESIKAYLFAHRSAIGVSYYDDTLSADEAARHIYAQMKGQRPNGLRAINAALRGWVPGQPKMESFKKAGSNETDWEAYDAAVEAFRKAYWIRQKPKLVGSGADLYVFSFGDENGTIGGLLEHGDIFRAVPHLVISQH
jgi:hypothetical protein